MQLDIEALSGIFGSVSIACWVVVFSPQIIENFRRSSAEGLSIVFLVIWLAGDAFNIVGGLLQGILPTMIILAVYYTLADIVLILQVFYYRGLTLKDKVPNHEAPPPNVTDAREPDERSALLSHPVNGSESLDQPNGSASARNSPSQNPLAQVGSRRSSFRDHLKSLDGTHLSPATPLHSKKRDDAALKAQSPVQKRQPLIRSILFNLTAVVVVCAAGVLGWWLSTRVPSRSHHDEHSKSYTRFFEVLHPTASGKHHHLGHKNGSEQGTKIKFSVVGQVAGYICAALYLGSRVPQLLLNYRRKSTDGISMLFFIFACIGNLAYVLSILAYEPPCYHSQRLAGNLKSSHVWNDTANSASSCKPGEAGQQYLRNFLVNLSWLLGSFGTLLLDAGVFVQWYKYRDTEASKAQQGDDVAVDGSEDVRR